MFDLLEELKKRKLKADDFVAESKLFGLQKDIDHALGKSAAFQELIDILEYCEDCYELNLKHNIDQEYHKCPSCMERMSERNYESASGGNYVEESYQAAVEQRRELRK